MRKSVPWVSLVSLALVAATGTACATSDAGGPGHDTTTTVHCPPVGPGADLSGCDLSNTNLMGADLHGAKLKNTDLEYSNLSGANLSNTQFYGAFFTGANFSSANITDSQLNPVMGKKGPVSPESGTGVGANFTDADLSGSAITANLTDANFTRADLGGTASNPYSSFVESNLTDANFTDASLPGTEIVLTNLTGANFTGVDLSTVALWTNDICPNGTNSDNDGDTCQYSTVPGE